LAAPLYYPGATTVGIRGVDSVVIAAEKRFAYGYFVMSKQAKKVFKITNYVGAACAGVVADMQNVLKEVKAYANLYRLEQNIEPNVRTVAKMLSLNLFGNRYFPYFMETIVGGVDREGPHVIVLDPLGSMIEDDYAVVGTGAEIAVGVIESSYRRDMSAKEIYELAARSVRASIGRDAGSGNGIDLLLYTQEGLKAEETLPV
jgi:proteasome beta subunit